MKAGALLAAIVIVSPVLGFLPVLSLRVRTSKLPKPFKETLSTLAKASVTTSTKAVTTLSTSVFVNSVLEAIAYTNSVLFIFIISISRNLG